uniref:Uncharacterized protein n=1 Tax=Heterorhabditis bacteriophora TaxID=37862 RepID=A0A1I7WC32_HETBA
MKLLRNLKMNGLRITPQDVFYLRRELQTDYNDQKNVKERRKCLQEACSTLYELKIELMEEIELSECKIASTTFLENAYFHCKNLWKNRNGEDLQYRWEYERKTCQLINYLVVQQIKNTNYLLASKSSPSQTQVI